MSLFSVLSWHFGWSLDAYFHFFDAIAMDAIASAFSDFRRAGFKDKRVLHVRWIPMVSRNVEVSHIAGLACMLRCNLELTGPIATIVEIRFVLKLIHLLVTMVNKRPSRTQWFKHILGLLQAVLILEVSQDMHSSFVVRLSILIFAMGRGVFTSHVFLKKAHGGVEELRIFRGCPDHIRLVALVRLQ